MLWIVSELDIIDKHRMLVVAERQFRPIRQTYTINDMESIDLTTPSRAWNPLKDGAEVASIDFSAYSFKAEDKMHVNLEAEIGVLFDETGTGCDKQPVQQILRGCIHYVSAIIQIFDSRFFR